MAQFSENEVRQELEPYHGRIRSVIEAGFQEWLEVKDFLAKRGHGSVLYPRTIANFVFDAVVRRALAEFGDDGDIRIVQESQTVKFCFGEVVLARFKKGDEDNLGRNLLTQAVLDFVSAETILPGLPPSTAKVEVLYSATELGDGIEQVIVAARDGDHLLWHYELDEGGDAANIIPLPLSVDPDGDNDIPLVSVRKIKDDTADNEGE